MMIGYLRIQLQHGSPWAELNVGGHAPTGIAPVRRNGFMPILEQIRAFLWPTGMAMKTVTTMGVDRPSDSVPRLERLTS